MASLIPNLVGRSCAKLLNGQMGAALTCMPRQASPGRMSSLMFAGLFRNNSSAFILHGSCRARQLVPRERRNIVPVNTGRKPNMRASNCNGASAFRYLAIKQRGEDRAILASLSDHDRDIAAMDGVRGNIALDLNTDSKVL